MPLLYQLGKTDAETRKMFITARRTHAVEVLILKNWSPRIYSLWSNSLILLFMRKSLECLRETVLQYNNVKMIEQLDIPSQQFQKQKQQ
jgi:hypothetical protein